MKLLTLLFLLTLNLGLNCHSIWAIESSIVARHCIDVASQLSADELQSRENTETDDKIREFFFSYFQSSLITTEEALTHRYEDLNQALGATGEIGPLLEYCHHLLREFYTAQVAASAPLERRTSRAGGLRVYDLEATDLKATFVESDDEESGAPGGAPFSGERPPGDLGGGLRGVSYHDFGAFDRRSPGRLTSPASSTAAIAASRPRSPEIPLIIIDGVIHVRPAPSLEQTVEEPAASPVDCLGLPILPPLESHPPFSRGPTQSIETVQVRPATRSVRFTDRGDGRRTPLATLPAGSNTP